VATAAKSATIASQKTRGSGARVGALGGGPSSTGSNTGSSAGSTPSCRESPGVSRATSALSRPDRAVTRSATNIPTSAARVATRHAKIPTCQPSPAPRAAPRIRGENSPTQAAAALASVMTRALCCGWASDSLAIDALSMVPPPVAPTQTSPRMSPKATAPEATTGARTMLASAAATTISPAFVARSRPCLRTARGAAIEAVIIPSARAVPISPAAARDMPRSSLRIGLTGPVR